MLRIAITAPEPRVDDPGRIAALLERGWHYVHLRYPALDENATSRIIRQLPINMRERIVLHDHLALAASLGCRIHLNGRNPAPPKGYTGTFSASCHSLDEALLAAGDPRTEYVTLSPCFGSISKPGYGPATDILKAVSELKDNPKRLKIIALGGVTPERLSQIRKTGFGGFAVLGALFGPDVDSQRFAFALEAFDNY